MRRAYLAEIAFPDRARVLEVGCGTGAVTRELAGWPQVAEVVVFHTTPVPHPRPRAGPGRGRPRPAARRPPGLVEAAGFGLVSVRGFSYLESTDARYMPTIVERGADALAAAGRLGPRPPPPSRPRPTGGSPPAGSSATSPTPAWSPGAPADPATPYWSAAGR
jgi:hypothetical protein